MFYDGQTSFARSGVKIIHGNLIGPTAEIGVCIRDVEDGAVAPGEVSIHWMLSIAWSL